MEDQLTRSMRRASWILACVLAQPDRDAVIGDLIEEYALRSRSDTASRAGRWYWGQVVRSLPALMWAPVRRGGVLATIGVAIGACAVQAVVELGSKAAIASLLAVDGRLPAILTALVAFPTLTALSYLAARIRPGAATMITALVVGAIGIQLAVKGHDMPLWTQLSALIGGPSAAFAGGVLSVRRSVPATNEGNRS